MSTLICYAISLWIFMFVPSIFCLNADEINVFDMNGVGFDFDGDDIVFKSNGLPKMEDGIVFGNINSTSVAVSVPLQPSLLGGDGSLCLPNGIIGIAINGIPIYNPYTSDCCNAGVIEKKKMDGCWGKKNEDGHYYYNTPPLCLFKNECKTSQLIGVALDGFPIYTPFDKFGNSISSSDLDKCNGRSDFSKSYRYHMTTEFPYMIGCFRGSLSMPQQCGACETTSPSCNSQQAEDMFNGTCCNKGDNCTYIRNEYYSSGERLFSGCYLLALLFGVSSFTFLSL